MRRATTLLVAAGALALPACHVRDPQRAREKDAARATGGDPARGRAAVERYGCATCHTIPGVTGDANVGSPLDRVGSRVYIAGVLVNTPANMVRWIKNPPEVDPQTAMPNVGATDADAADIACYLYTLR